MSAESILGNHNKTTLLILLYKFKLISIELDCTGIIKSDDAPFLNSNAMRVMRARYGQKILGS
ncbi:hypothetical protein A0J61_10450 [Choanephora cucurbitarum]|uniref:Uncharacterized protein n=1 Tax=Choanephora cucurbitarum TaxID=101091 RepID=A0A1C7MXL5_9FUNG|nr:hypothetical protein A0J61_10450 [Choanephora cucurbitarum]